MAVSVVLNTYNRARLLSLVLAAWTRQTERDFEIVVADDGSTDGTEAVIAEARRKVFFPLTHVRTEREGYWRTRILNEGIKACRHDVVLFTDADCLPRADLVAAHLRHFDPRRLSIGGCIRLGERDSRGLALEEARSGAYERHLDGRRRVRLVAQHWKNRWQILVRRRRRPHNRGVNMAVSRRALLEVNGFDEEMRGWGNEDGELRERLKRIGVFPKSVSDRAIVLHLWHPPDPTRFERRNAAYARRGEVPARCERGILKPGETEPAPPPVVSSSEEVGAKP